MTLADPCIGWLYG